MKAGKWALALLGCAAGLATGTGQAQTGTKPVIAAPPAETQTEAPASAPVTAAAQQGTIDPDYVIGPGDVLEVDVFNEPKFSGQLPVRPDGMISITLIGDLLASGFTPMQLSADITSRLKKLITDPSVTVKVVSIGSKRIYLVGEVGHVGPLPMTAGMTPLQAIATAGGLGPYANAKKVYILRKVNGKEQKIPFNYRKAIKEGDMQGVTLLNGDTIVVP